MIGLGFFVYLKFFWGFGVGDEPFDDQTPNEFWGAILPYLTIVAALMVIAGLALLRNIGTAVD